jgi:predicted Rossmann fold nucleotide-binding protein DprA/Smf involved in DNA uptake
VVVLGCGLDVAYPRANTGLFASVLAAGGSVVSEHPPGAAPRPVNFPPRNRLILHSGGALGFDADLRPHSCWSAPSIRL